MEFTPFAGLTELEENDPITLDGGSFLTKNPKITDQLLRVGAVTHRHDAHPRLVNPHVGLTGQVVASGGTLSGSSQFALTYTVVDAQGGETTAGPPVVLVTGSQVGLPTVAPQAALITSAGIMPAGSYFYALTYTDGDGGETPLGPQTLIQIPPGNASASILLSGLATELHAGGPVNWRLWRSYEGQDWHLVTQGASNTYDDAGFNPPDDPARPPLGNTTASTYSLLVTIPTAAQEPAIASGAAINLYLAPDTNFNDPSFYLQVPIGSAGHTLQITQETTSAGSPPRVSTSIQGAGQIYPDTDLIFGVKSPVGNASLLPSGAMGDLRMTLGDQHLHAVLSPSAGVPADWVDLTALWEQPRLMLGASGRTNVIGPEGYVEFAGSGGVGVALQQIGGGSGRVLIGIPPGLMLGASGQTSLAGPESYIEIAGSGGVGVAIQQIAGGSARILIGMPPAAGGGGGTGLGEISGSAHAGAISPINDIEFAGSGNTGVAVQDLGGGSARVLISAGGGSLTGIALAGSGGVGEILPETYVEFVGSGGTGVAVQNIGGGSARVVISGGGGGTASATGSPFTFLGSPGGLVNIGTGMGNPQTFTPGVAIAAGTLCVVAIVFKSGLLTHTFSVTDSKSNTWRFGADWIDGLNGAAGPVVALAWSILTTPLTNTDTVSINNGQTAQNDCAAVMATWTPTGTVRFPIGDARTSLGSNGQRLGVPLTCPAGSLLVGAGAGGRVGSQSDLTLDTDRCAGWNLINSFSNGQGTIDFRWKIASGPPDMYAVKSTDFPMAVAAIAFG